MKERHKNEDLDTKLLIREYEEIINILFVLCIGKALLLKSSQEKENLIRIMSKSTIIFMINMVKTIDKYPKLKKSLVSLDLLKKFLSLLKKYVRRRLLYLNRHQQIRLKLTNIKTLVANFLI